MVLTVRLSIDPLVLWVIPVSGLGGVARHVLDVARVKVPGFRVWFLCPPGPLAEALRELGAPVLTGEIGPQFGARTSVRTLRRTVSRLRPAIVHSHLAHADVVAAVAMVGLPVKLVSTEHGIAGNDRVYHGNPIRQGVMAAVHTVRARRFASLIAVAEATAAAMRAKWHVRDVTVILNGIDRPDPVPGPVEGQAHSSVPERVDGGDPHADGQTAEMAPSLRVSSLARLSPEKGLPALLEAFAVLRRTHPQSTLTVAGEGPLHGELAAQAVRLGIGDSVTFPGFVDADELLSETDVLVQLSVWENCSYALLDALVAGVGVCATPVGGNPEILPPACLVSSAEPAEVAAVIAEQANPMNRPVLRGGWPTVAEMAGLIGAEYERVLR